MIKKHLEFNNDVWFAGGAWTWTGFVPNNHFTMQTMKQAMLSCKQFGVENIFITTWGDNGTETSYYSILPSLFAIRKFYEGVTNMNVIKAEFKEITGESFDAFVGLDLPNRIVGAYTSENPCKHMLYSDPFLGFFDSTIIVGAGEKYKKLAKRFAVQAKRSSYGYIFQSMSKLCDVLSIKYELGRKTREAYQKGDKESLKSLVLDYKKLDKKLKAFHIAFRNVWYTENKPNGFEVHDVRIGGLEKRLEVCHERLIEYLDGKIDKIPELEEKLLDFHGKGEEFLALPARYHRWAAAISPNSI
jgi:hypothetical protein